MTRAHAALLVVGTAIIAACSGAPPKDTLATLHDVAPDLQDVKVEGGVDTAMQSYQRFLEETPEMQRTPEAMRRLADLKIEKEYGLNGTGELLELPAPQAADLPTASSVAATTKSAACRKLSRTVALSSGSGTRPALATAAAACSALA